MLNTWFDRTNGWGYTLFSLQMYLLRAAGILLPFYVAMRLIRMVQRGQQYRWQMLEVSVSPGFHSLVSWGAQIISWLNMLSSLFSNLFLQDQRRNASTMNHMHGQEQQQQLVISIN
jgi:hypothetical protein